MSATAQSTVCERNLIAAYIDGELEPDVTLRLEAHLQSCASCRAELRAHQLFVCELDAALTCDAEILVPDNFSRLIAARATSDMSGVRTRPEHRKALSICAILALTGFALAGTTTREAIFTLGRKFVSTFFGVAGFVSTAVYDTVAGLAVIFRVVSRKVIIESGSLGPMLVLLAVAIVLLSRMISNYHRAGATD
jgi:predicted anti-sigma-YlaC factor YlaD